MPEVYFDERIAAGYDEDSAEMYAPAVLDPMVDLLAELADDGRAESTRHLSAWPKLSA
jgi:hypothetical protein